MLGCERLPGCHSVTFCSLPIIWTGSGVDRIERGLVMGHLAKELRVVAVGLLCVGCTTPPSGFVGPSPTSAPSQVRSIEDALGCGLVDFPTGDWAGQPAATAQGAVHALVADLGLDQADVQPWAGDIPATDDGGRWLLFKTDGTGYGVAIAGTIGEGQWIATADQTCAAVIPLPVVTNGSSSPSAGPPS